MSIMGTFIVIPPSILMDQIFRKARPKPSKTDTLLKRVEERQDELEEKRQNNDYDTGYEDDDYQPDGMKDEKDPEKDVDYDYTSSEIGKLLVVSIS